MDFYRRLALAGEKIPCGRVATYGQLALLCGKPRCSRQVGRALKYGLAGSAFPAYRVVNSRGILSGASSFDTPDMQKLLLEAEGRLPEALNCFREACRESKGNFLARAKVDELEKRLRKKR